ncbi:MAG: cation:proton antiporter [Oligoflexia bacterium]|nr:cation:proton antiporter [Oligoflexia bacterium]
MLIEQIQLVPLVIAVTILLSSIISLKFGLSVAIIEIILGAFAGNFLGLKAEPWMLYLANFGGVVLTFLAGTEIDTRVMKEKFKESFLIGFFSFLLPFLAAATYTYWIAGWTLSASLIAGTALSTTSLAVVYSVLIEMGLSKTELGKLLMAATFITDIGTALALSILFAHPTPYMMLFLVISVLVIWLAVKFSHHIFSSPRLKNKVIEPEIKYIFVLLVTLMYFANLGNGHAVLPVFIMGLLMSKHFSETSVASDVRNRLRTVAYAMITPIFFIVGGLKISFTVLIGSAVLFMVLFIIKIAAKFVGVYFLAKKFIPHGSMYTTLLMSTGLTFGTISSVYGLNAGIINQGQYSILVGVVVASAVIPTFIAQKWFAPVHSEDITDIENSDNQK